MASILARFSNAFKRENIDSNDLNLAETLHAKIIAHEPYLELNVASWTVFDCQRYLVANKGDMDKAFEAIGKTLRWRRDENIDTIINEDFTDVVKGMQVECKIIIHGFAKDGTPIMIWRSCNHYPLSESKRKRQLRYICYLLETSIRQGILKTGCTFLYDRTHSSRENLDLSMYSNMAPLLREHYPERLKLCIVFPANSFFWLVWKIVKPLMDKNTVAKIQICTFDSYQKALLEVIDPDQLFTEFGGQVESAIMKQRVDRAALQSSADDLVAAEKNIKALEEVAQGNDDEEEDDFVDAQEN